MLRAGARPAGAADAGVRTTWAMTAALLGLGDWLAGLGVTRVVMEATSDYWRAPFYLLDEPPPGSWADHGVQPGPGSHQADQTAPSVPVVNRFR